MLDRRTGIVVDGANDNIVIEDNAIKEFASGVILRSVDALHVRNNMILENISCLRLEGQGIASIVSNNRIGGKPGGISLFAEGHDRLVISDNNIFPDGYANLVLKNCRACTVTGNQLLSFYTGLLHLEGDCLDNVISGNQLSSTPGPNGQWNANPEVTRNVDFGMLRVEGRGNLLVGNAIRSYGTEAHALMVLAGTENTVATHKLVADRSDVDPIRVTAGTGVDANSVIGLRRPRRPAYSAWRTRTLPPAARARLKTINSTGSRTEICAVQHRRLAQRGEIG